MIAAPSDVLERASGRAPEPQHFGLESQMHDIHILYS